jgi:hypothetical protein
MIILKTEYLISCREFVNGTQYYDNYQTFERNELQNILLSGMPFYDTVSFHNFKYFDKMKMFLIFLFFKNKLCYFENDFFNILVSKKFGKFNVT